MLLCDRFKKIEVRSSHGEYNRLSTRTFANHMEKDLLGAQNGTSYNALNLRPILQSNRPLLSFIPRYRFLETICELADNVDPGKQLEARSNDVKSCLSFSIMGLTHSFSGAHVDSLLGTWVRCLFGTKFWMIVPSRIMTEADWEDFGRR